MLVISGTAQIRPDKIDEARSTAIAMAAQSSAEAGCRTYELSALLTDPTTFRLFEEWESPEALSAHFQTPHFKAFAAALPNVLAAPPLFLRYEVASVGPL